MIPSKKESLATYDHDPIAGTYHRPLFLLVGDAHRIHRTHFPSCEVQASALLSIKTGGCPENCSYCPQSAHYSTGITKSKLLEKDEVLAAALKAKNSGATRFCMGAAWREVKDGAEFDHVIEHVKNVKSLGLEVCCTLGMLKPYQALRLKEAGLDFYNHNVDTSPEFYKTVVQTRTYQDRLDTLQAVRDSGVKVCTGGILGLGERDEDRIEFIRQLVQLKPQPESLTVNVLVRTPGTPLANLSPLDPLILVRVIATLRVLSPLSMIRLSAGRTELNSETQFLCFLAGANSIFFGDKLLTSPNPETSLDVNLLHKVGLQLQPQSISSESRI